ncbi:MAG: cupin-like domain-containing protein [Gammaproteobacteria bacterium]|nr:cupin-like domain-containing protein [Gammaproteobacteria bacterium]
MNALSDIAAVELVEGSSPDAIPSEVLQSDVPLLLKGMVADWPAVKACSESLPGAARYLSQFWTNDLVTVYVSDENKGRFFYNDDCTGFNFQAGTAPLQQVMVKLAENPGNDGQSIYVGSTNIDHWFPGFRKENDLAMPSDGLVSIWIGNKTRISAHYDYPDNVACVVAGERRFTLFPPEQIDNLYIGPVDRTPSGQAISLVDFANPDFDKHPRFEEALKHALVCDMEPGDAIFLPSMWWHHVEAFSPFNILVNYWWISSPVNTDSPRTALLHGILAMRDLPERQRAAWKKMFDYYVFEADEKVYEHIPEPGRGCLAPLDKASAQTLLDEVIKRLG